MNKNMMIGVLVLVLLVVGGWWYKNKSGEEMMTTDSDMTLEGSDAGDDTAMMDDGTMTVDLAAVTGAAATQTGTATLKEVDGKVQVDLKVDPAMTTPQPVHIHMGECPGVGEVKFTLTNIVDGMSTTTLDTTMDALKAEKLAINVHKSADEVKVYTACGTL